ncbi:polysaccharide biosynthesis protein GumN [Burkholderia territorii]|uniref:Polysaccharide biosynthesis protein GumN n=3 Tax=Burkholderia territorii TaxID=1503055 RepID=A0A105DPA6_9BURK|nr:TraB/GumN family protein [Burkholderia territorii]KVL39087.1 polysaccharide biosynthesis protein GumN [Burkholderia territorii]KVL40208.1 polysaccharide biosynthesis protein GumN [Burkholderia territorii]KVQ42669.1 polysaccharide biosynthesis protein GumN [Burkholderia territorii]KVQ56315.1 polysaccharide biosynthesis protein GumN [Burkholderia territorii]KWA13045.1 polysaccharide biosynthesis protein GumN [Burkholderia territorii]
MPDGLAARASGVRRSGAGRARMMRACRNARRWSVRTVTGAALAGACVAAGLVVPVGAARAEGRAPASSPIHTSQVPPPGMSLPGFHAPSVSNGTVARGTVRVQPARMPFYVATKGKVTLYVLGTLHTGDPSDYPPAQPFRPRILGALAASPTLALELSPDDLLESQDDVSKYGVCRYPCLQRLLPESLWQRLAGRLRGNPAALAEIRRMRPWLAALVVETYDSLSAGLQTEYGTEAQLQNVFLKKKGGRVIGLETLAEQMRAFTGLTLAEQREMLAQDMVQTPAQNADDIKALHRLWQIGDADAIFAWAVAKSERLARSKTLSASIDNKILYERNRRFVARMTAIAAPNRPVFVAIGALHLGGPRGVLELLRQQGYSVDAN